LTQFGLHIWVGPNFLYEATTDQGDHEIMYDNHLPGSVTFDMNTLSDSSTQNASRRHFIAIKEHLFSNLNDEAVILSLKNGKYYGLNAVGGSIWGAIQESRTLEQIETIIMSEYDVDLTTCRTEIKTFLETMLAEELIETVDA
jgi:hypothetical protein